MVFLSNPIIPNIKKAAIKFGTTPIKDNFIFLKNIKTLQIYQSLLILMLKFEI